MIRINLSLSLSHYRYLSANHTPATTTSEDHDDEDHLGLGEALQMLVDQGLVTATTSDSSADRDTGAPDSDLDESEWREMKLNARLLTVEEHAEELALENIQLKDTIAALRKAIAFLKGERCAHLSHSERVYLLQLQLTYMARVTTALAEE